MKNTLKAALLFLMLCTLEVNAQNYSPIIPGNTSLFMVENNAIAALHVDSTTSDSKGIAHHFLKTWQPGSTECMDYHKATWAGPKCVKNNNTHFFFNDNLDTIYFYPSKEVNTRWKFYSYANGDYIEAIVTAKAIKTFLGLTDSVKTISLQRKDVNGNNLSNNMIGTSLEYSKYYGFTKAFSFLYFPDLTTALDTHYELTLVGLTSPKVGTQLITSNDIFNYDIGDVFHYDTVYSNHGVVRFGKRICTILEKSISVNTDTVTYKIARATEIKDLAQNTIYNQKDTIIEKHILNEPLYYPEQAIPIIDPSLFLEKKPFPLYKLTQNSDYNNRPLLSPSYYYPSYNGACWTDILYEFAPPSYSYGNGLGLAEYDALPFGDGSGGIDQQYIRLVYYKKGSETWGTPLTLSTYSKLNNITASLYPNPLKQGEQLHIETGNFQTKQVTIYNTIGTRIKDIPNTASSIESIDVSELQPGLYVVQLLNEKNEFIISKLIIK